MNTSDMWSQFTVQPQSLVLLRKMISQGGLLHKKKQEENSRKGLQRGHTADLLLYALSSIVITA